MVIGTWEEHRNIHYTGDTMYTSKVQSSRLTLTST